MRTINSLSLQVVTYLAVARTAIHHLATWPVKDAQRIATLKLHLKQTIRPILFRQGDACHFSVMNGIFPHILCMRLGMDSYID